MKSNNDKDKEFYDNLDWPSTSNEEWKRTDLKALKLETYDSFKNNSLLLSDKLDLNEQIKTGILINQGFLADKRTESDSPKLNYCTTKNIDLSKFDSIDKIELMHHLKNEKNVEIEAEKNRSYTNPVYVNFHFAGNKSLYAPQINIMAHESSKIQIVINLQHSDEDTLINSRINVKVAANAEVSIYLLNSGGEKAKIFLNYDFKQDKDSRISLNEFHLGGIFLKSRLTGNLNNAGSSLHLRGGYYVTDKKHFDICTYQNHNTEYTYSNALYKGVINPGGRAVFQGLINVSENARGTDAYLKNRNILTGDGARADSIPKLNIKTNDVKCSHGSTTGKLDENQLYYLQTRGYSLFEAKKILLKGFYSEIIDNYPKILKNEIEAALEHKINSGDSIG